MDTLTSVNGQGYTMTQDTRTWRFSPERTNRVYVGTIGTRPPLSTRSSPRAASCTTRLARATEATDPPRTARSRTPRRHHRGAARIVQPAISIACQLRKKAAAAEIGRLGVWTNHVKTSVLYVRERSTAQRAHCKSPARIRIGEWPQRGLRGGEWLGGRSNRLHPVQCGIEVLAQQPATPRAARGTVVEGGASRGREPRK